MEIMMYSKATTGQLTLGDFYLPFGGKLKADNRWVILSKSIPWDKIEDEYASNFSENKLSGNKAMSVRIALGALIIKERLGITDRETVAQIRENPYLQYFLGYSEYLQDDPFDDSLMTYFRKRFDKDTLTKINKMIVIDSFEKEKDEDVAEEDNNDDEPENKGKLLVDATCTPADISYPTDLNLLNEAREKTEAIIDEMHKPRKGIHIKPRTYRVKARKDYLKVAKQKSPGRKKVRKAIGKQLGFISRNLKSTDRLIEEGQLQQLSKRQYRNLLVISELFRQQSEMYISKVHSIEDRIVSISQPHIRPIVRGKAKAKTEFGAKVSASVVEGFVFADKISFDAYNESTDLVEQIENYHDMFGYYPESVHADKIYRTRENRKFCKNNGIRLSGQPLGRPPKVTAENAEELKQRKKIAYQDEVDRIPVEGKFGQGKRRFGLSRIMAKLKSTATTAIMISFITMNLEKILTQTLAFLVSIFQRSTQKIKWIKKLISMYISSLINMKYQEIVI
jgi:transposase, IS5 family